MELSTLSVSRGLTTVNNWFKFKGLAPGCRVTHGDNIGLVGVGVGKLPTGGVTELPRAWGEG